MLNKYRGDIKATVIFQLAMLLVAFGSSIICQRFSNIHLDPQIAKAPELSVDRAQGEVFIHSGKVS